MAVAEYRFYEQQDFAGALARLRTGAASTRVRRCTGWRCSRPPSAPGSWGAPRRRPRASRRCWIWARRPRQRQRRRAEARRRAVRSGAGVPGRAVHRGRQQDRRGRPRLPGPDRRQGLFAAGDAAVRRHGLRSDPLRARRRGLPVPDRPGPQEPRRARSSRSGWSSRTRRWAGRPRGGRDAQAGQRLRPAERVGQGQRRSAQADRRGPRARPRGSSAPRPSSCTPRPRRTRRNRGRSTSALYAQAAEAYAFYLEQFPDAKDAAELRYLRADILYFKLGDYRAAGTEYLAVGRSKPVGPNHKDALLNAMNAFEKLRPPAPAGRAARKREVTDDDRRFAEAADLYATLFPNDKEIVTVIYKNGQFFYDHGDYDEAIKRFGLIIEQHPDSPVAGAAGDRLLECLDEAKDYANIEHWSRRLKKTTRLRRPQGAGPPGRPDRRGDAEAGRGPGGQGRPRRRRPRHFRRVGRGLPQPPVGAAQAWNNAGAAAEKAGRPERGGRRLQDAGRSLSRSRARRPGACWWPRQDRGEHRRLRPGGGPVRAAGHALPAVVRRPAGPAPGGAAAPDAGPIRSRRRPLRRIREAVQGAARDPPGGLPEGPGDGRAQGLEGGGGGVRRLRPQLRPRPHAWSRRWCARARPT